MAKKRKSGTKSKIKCPVCECSSLVAIPKKACLSCCECPCCKETIEADVCCILCDYSNTPCGKCKKKKKK